MRRKTALRLIAAVLISVLLWILWFSISFDVKEKNFEDHSELGSKLYIDEPKKIAKIRQGVALPDDLNSIDIPLLDISDNEMVTGQEEETGKTTGLTFRNKIFFLNGKSFRIFSGAVHYFRIVPEYWEDRLKKLKACGLNTVETYVAWNLHEPSPGIFNFEGMLDVRKFIQLAERLGLYVIFRPGPFICSEFEFGGLPGWLLRDPNMKVRTNYPGYVLAVNRYFDVLLPLVHDLQFTEGGPIIMYQVENEYSSYGQDIQHLKLLTYIMKNLGVKELLATSDHEFSEKYTRNKDIDFSKYALLTHNLDRVSPTTFSINRVLNKHFPMMVMELWSGWFDSWGQKYHSSGKIEDFNASVNYIINEGGSFNVYMFIGGTNFGFTSGAINFTTYQPLVTSYDYDAPLSEAGDITQKYLLLRDLLGKFYMSIGFSSLPPVPPNLPKADYGEVEVTEIMEWDIFISLIPIAATDNKVNFMEVYKDKDGLHNNMGYIVYSFYIEDDTHWNKLPGVQLTGYAKDRLTAILNSEIFYVKDDIKADDEDTFMPYDWDEKFQKDPYEYMFNYSHEYDVIFEKPRWLFSFLQKVKEMALKMKKREPKKVSGRLDLMVENQGRVNFSLRNKPILDIQRKGLQGPVFRYIFGIMEEWHIKFINFNSDQCMILSRSSTWSTVEAVQERKKEQEEIEKIAPTLYRAYLNVTGAPKDTFVKLEGWNKGVVIVNGFNLGRYWQIGPQRTLYLPAPILKEGRNEVLVFEELGRGKNLRFQASPELQ